jgi:hypothetical protein
MTFKLNLKEIYPKRIKKQQQQQQNKANKNP